MAPLGGGCDVYVVAGRDVRVQSGALHGEVAVRETSVHESMWVVVMM